MGADDLRGSGQDRAAHQPHDDDDVHPSHDDDQQYSCLIHVNLYLDFDYHHGGPDDLCIIDNRRPQHLGSHTLDVALHLHDDVLTDVYKLLHDARPDIYHSGEPGDATSTCDWCDDAATRRYRSTLKLPDQCGSDDAAH